MDEYQNPEPIQESQMEQLFSRVRASSKKERILAGVGILLLFILVLYISFYKTPSDFPKDKVVTISSGESLQQITSDLYEKNVIKSPLVFRSLVILLGGEKKIIAGDYLLESRESPLTLAYRFMQGDFDLEPITITIPEGRNIFQMADYFEENLVEFDKTLFLNLAQKEEGYLFPDTYFVSPVIKPATLIALMKGNFDKKMEEILSVYSTDRPIEDIIVMASLLEAEAKTTESRRIIAGILWKRISIGMPLQVDSTFSYVNGKNTYELTLADLEIDSLYNTYKYRGLPPGPITNPGTDSIIAAMTPISTKYLYFLSSRSGDMYYGRTFEEHKRNKERYLND